MTKLINDFLNETNTKDTANIGPNDVNITAGILSAFCLMLVASMMNLASAQVTVDTSDEALLEGKDVSEMFDVAKPIARLELHIEGIDEPVAVRYNKNATVLYTSADDAQDIERIRTSFMQLTDIQNVIVKDKSALESLVKN